MQGDECEATAKFVAMLARRGLLNAEYTVTPKDLEGWRITRSIAAWSRAVKLAKREQQRREVAFHP